MKLNVNDKVAVVTGGSRGLGFNCCKTLVKNGISKLFLTSRKKKQLDEAVESLKQLGNEYKNSQVEIYAIASDLSNKDGILKFFSYVSNLTSSVDILIINAGASWGASFLKHSEQAFNKVVDLNLKSVFLTIQSFYPLLVKNASPDYSSRVLIMGSIAGITVGSTGTGTYGYTASKAGVMHLGKLLAVELGPNNINVNIIAPGFFPTKMSNGLIDKFGDAMVASNPKRRLGEQKDIESVVLFFCAKESDYINGCVIPLDGGAHLVVDSKL